MSFEHPNCQVPEYCPQYICSNRRDNGNSPRNTHYKEKCT